MEVRKIAKSNKKRSKNKDVKVKFFYSVSLNKNKCDSLVAYAELAKDVRNFVSEYVYNSNDLKIRILLNTYTDIDLKIELKDYRKQFKGILGTDEQIDISATAFQNCCKEVHIRYQTYLQNELTKKLENYNSIRKYLSFLIKYYKGDLNELTNLISQEKIKTFFNEKTNKKEFTEKAVFYQNLEKFLFNKTRYNVNKILNMVENLRQRLIKNITLINFKSLTFQDLNVLSINHEKGRTGNIIDILEENSNKVIINLNLAGYKQIVIPTKFSKKYHGNLDCYNGKPYKMNSNGSMGKRVTYTIKFLKDRKVKIILYQEVEKLNYTYDNNRNNILGVDVNTSSNLFSLSNGVQIPYDEKIVNQAAKLNKTISYKQANKFASEKNVDEVNKVYSKKIRRRIDKMVRRAEYYQNYKSHELIEYMKNNNFNYLVMEDLDIKSSKTKTKKNANCTKINYNDVAQTLRINNLKNVLERLCKKENFNFAKVNPAYTSQTCSVCGNIDKKSRNHRMFLCTNCHHSDDADINAAKNIKNRITNPMLKLNLIRFDNENQIHVGSKHKNKSFYEKVYKNLNATKPYKI